MMDNAKGVAHMPTATTAAEDRTIFGFKIDPKSPTRLPEERKIKTDLSILGREARGSANENMGRVVNVIVDGTGRVRAAVIDFGGFLGVGSRKIAVDWNVLRFNPESTKRDAITLELTRDQLKEAAEYKDKQSVVVLGAAGGLEPLLIN